MSALSRPFKSTKGEADYMASYDASMKLWNVPYDAIELPSRFGSTHVVACGPENGPPLVLLHCFFMSLSVWARNVGALSQQYRVYAIDMMGQPGKSAPDQPIGDREEMAEWLTSTLDGLAIGQTDLIGWSYSGFAALNYALRNPSRIGRLVLHTPIGSFVPLKKQFYVRGMLTRLPGRYWAQSMMNWFTYAPTLANAHTKRFFDTVTEQFILGLRHFRLPVAVLPTPFGDDELRGLRLPTLLLIGEQEALYDPHKAAARATMLVPGLQVELIPGAGHALPACKPEVVNALVLDFLSRSAAYGSSASCSRPSVSSS